MAKKTEPNPDHIDALPVADMGSTEDAAAPPETDAGLERISPAETAGSPSGAPSQRSGFVGMILGGGLAAVGGFAVSHYDLFDLRSGNDLAPVTEALARQDKETKALGGALDTAISELKNENKDLSARIGELEAGAGKLSTAIDPALGDRVAGLENQISALAVTSGDPAQLASLAERLGQLDQRIAELSAPGAALPAEAKAEIDAAMARLAEAETQAVAKATEAESTLKVARQTAALDRIEIALNDGSAFSAALGDLGDLEIPVVLTENAANGIIPLRKLQASFPEAARSALRAAWDAGAAPGWGARLAEFLKAQTGARSLTPQQGKDPDAVLSRAEAALKDGRLADALTEIAGLNDTVKAPLASWIAQAETRAAAQEAIVSLATSLNK